MRVTKTAISIATAIICCTSVWAVASEAAKIASDWGAIGQWAVDCDARAGRASAIYLEIKTKKDGTLVYLQNNGSKIMESKLPGARLMPNDVIEFHLNIAGDNDGNGNRTYAWKKIDKDTVRAMYSFNEKYEFTIKDGKIVSDGSDSRTLHRCN